MVKDWPAWYAANRKRINEKRRALYSKRKGGTIKAVKYPENRKPPLAKEGGCILCGRSYDQPCG